MSDVPYCTREDVLGSLDWAPGAAVNARVDSAVRAASALVEDVTGRTFCPQVATRYFDWPQPGQSSWSPSMPHADRDWPMYDAASQRLWLGEADLISVTSLTSGGVTIPPAQYVLYPDDGPPFTRIEIASTASVSFGGGTPSRQRNIAVTGVFGYSAITEPGSTLSALMGLPDQTLTVASGALIGVGSLVLIDAERMIVTERGWSVTGQTITVARGASKSDTLLTLSAPIGAVAGERLLIGAERVLVTDVVGSTVVVQRAVDGSVLAAIAPGAAVSASRLLTVTRGALGTTVATHAASAAVRVQAYPNLVRQLALAEAENLLLSAQSGYARTIGAGESIRNAQFAGLKTLRSQVAGAFRRVRIGAV